MNILWITNITFPEAQELLKGRGSLKGSGGWLLGAASELSEYNDIKLTVASVSRDVKVLTRLEGEKIAYYILPYGKGNMRINNDYEPLWKQVRNEVNPDVVHIHGTEYTHGLSYIKACGNKNVCVSIQGLVSEIHKYYYSGLCFKDIVKSTTLRSFLYGGIIKEKENLMKCGESEKEIIRQVNHVISRTTWSMAHIWAINPLANYYHCNETLRTVFYEGKNWTYNSCVPHSIFLSQSHAVIKGLHFILKAFPLVLRKYPDATIRIAGVDVAKYNASFIERMKLSNYGNYIRSLIKSLGLANRVTFTGPLGESEMRDEYLRCNLFVCPSSIENSPNSLGEAQILGVPCLGSFVGGVPDIMEGGEEYLYRYDDIDVLAYKICQIFDQQRTVNTRRMQEIAHNRYDRSSNLNSLLDIYQKIVKYN